MTGIVRDAVLCPCAKDTCSCYAYCEVARPILSQPRRKRLPRKSGANPDKRLPLLWLYELVFRNSRPFLGSYVFSGDGDQLLFKTTDHPVRGSPACGIVTEGYRWSSTCVQYAGCCLVLVACNAGLLSLVELCRNAAQQGSPSRLLYSN